MFVCLSVSPPLPPSLFLFSFSLSSPPLLLLISSLLPATVLRLPATTSTMSRRFASSILRMTTRRSSAVAKPAQDELIALKEKEKLPWGQLSVEEKTKRESQCIQQKREQERGARWMVPQTNVQLCGACAYTITLFSMLTHCAALLVLFFSDVRLCPLNPPPPKKKNSVPCRVWQDPQGAPDRRDRRHAGVLNG